MLIFLCCLLIHTCWWCKLWSIMEFGELVKMLDPGWSTCSCACLLLLGCDFVKPLSMAGASPKGTSAGSLAGTNWSCSLTLLAVTSPSLMARLQTLMILCFLDSFILCSNFCLQEWFSVLLSLALRSCTSSTSAHRQYLVRRFRSPDPLRSAGQLSSKTWTIKLPCSVLGSESLLQCRHNLPRPWRSSSLGTWSWSSKDVVLTSDNRNP